eukprot:1156985-Rhodomonas_salina.1
MSAPDIDQRAHSRVRIQFGSPHVRRSVTKARENQRCDAVVRRHPVLFRPQQQTGSISARHCDWEALWDGGRTWGAEVKRMFWAQRSARLSPCSPAHVGQFEASCTESRSRLRAHRCVVREVACWRSIGGVPTACLLHLKPTERVPTPPRGT